MANNEYQITAVINLHNEGFLAYATVRSALKAIEEAKQKMDLKSRLLLVLDNPNDVTISMVDNFSKIEYIEIINVDVKDLGLSRNEAVNICDSEYITFLDGDDLWGKDWLWRCYQADKEEKGREIVWHPEANIIFDNDYHIFHHTDMDSNDFVLDYLRISNYWTALSFAKTEAYRKTPFHRNRIKEGFGYEDWNWNCRTIKEGLTHKVALNTCHFIRRKKLGSMLQETNAGNCIVTPHKLF